MRQEVQGIISQDLLDRLLLSVKMKSKQYTMKVTSEMI